MDKSYLTRGINGLFIIGTIMAGVPISVQAASFDCGKASTVVEKMICADAELSKLDEQLVQEYKIALNKIENKDGFKKVQRDWLKNQRNICKDVNCLYEEYGVRINKLTSLHRKYESYIAEAKVKNKKEWKYVTYETKVFSDGSWGELNKLLDNPRPKNWFELAYSANEQVCKKALGVMNDGGTSAYNHISMWWLANKNMPDWEFIAVNKDDFYYYPPQYVSLDINNDGKNEYLYRHSADYGGKGFHNVIKIYDRQLPVSLNAMSPNNVKYGVWEGPIDNNLGDYAYSTISSIGLESVSYLGGDGTYELIKIDDEWYFMFMTIGPQYHYFNILLYQIRRDGSVISICGLAPKFWIKMIHSEGGNTG